MKKKPPEPQQESKEQKSAEEISDPAPAKPGETADAKPEAVQEDNPTAPENITAAPVPTDAGEANSDTAGAAPVEAVDEVVPETPAAAADSPAAIETTDERPDSTETTAPPEELEVALWRPAPRKPRRDHNKANAKPGQRRDGKKGAKSKHPRNNKPKTYSTEPRKSQRQKKADPNSPFAVLASLKSELSETPKDAKSKETEKAD